MSRDSFVLSQTGREGGIDPDLVQVASDTGCGGLGPPSTWLHVAREFWGNLV